KRSKAEIFECHHPIQRMRKKNPEAAAISQPNATAQRDHSRDDVAEMKHDGEDRRLRQTPARKEPCCQSELREGGNRAEREQTPARKQSPLRQGLREKPVIEQLADGGDKYHTADQQDKRATRSSHSLAWENRTKDAAG